MAQNQQLVSGGTVSTQQANFYPTIEPSIPHDVQRHLQLIYSKLNNHARAFGILNKNSVAAAAKTTIQASGTSGSSGSTAGVTSFNTQTGNVVYFPGNGQINDQTGSTAYSTQTIDNGRLIVLNSGSAIALTLDASTAAVPWFTIISNQGTGTVTITPSSGTVNGGASLTLPGGGLVEIYFDGTNWLASTGGSTVGGVTSLNALTGALALVAGSGVTITPAGSQITIASSGGGGGTITGVTAGTGLSGGGTSGTVTLNIASTTVTPGSYTSADITVNAEGQITAAANGGGGGGGYIKGTVGVSASGSSGTFRGTGTVTGATTSMAAIASAPGLIQLCGTSQVSWSCDVVGSNTVEVQVTLPNVGVSWGPTINFLVVCFP